MLKHTLIRVGGPTLSFAEDDPLGTTMSHPRVSRQLRPTGRAGAARRAGRERGKASVTSAAKAPGDGKRPCASSGDTPPAFIVMAYNTNISELIIWQARSLIAAHETEEFKVDYRDPSGRGAQWSSDLGQNREAFLGNGRACRIAACHLRELLL